MTSSRPGTQKLQPSSIAATGQLGRCSGWCGHAVSLGTAGCCSGQIRKTAEFLFEYVAPTGAEFWQRTAPRKHALKSASAQPATKQPFESSVPRHRRRRTVAGAEVAGRSCAPPGTNGNTGYQLSSASEASRKYRNVVAGSCQAQSIFCKTPTTVGAPCFCFRPVSRQ